jgi:hypothetical protein
MDDGKIAGDEHGQCSDPWFAFELGLNMLALFAEPSRQVEKGSYLREEWIDGQWVSLGDDPWGSLAHARTAVALIHEKSGNPVRIVKKTPIKTETVFHLGQET